MVLLLINAAMRKQIRNIVIFILICLSSILYGCEKKDNTEKSTDTAIEEETKIDYNNITRYPIEELNNNIKEVFIGNRFALSLGTIGNDGSILLGNIPEDESIVYLLNVETGIEIELDKIESSKHFGFAYQDDDIIVYYTYSIWGISAIPEEYYIYYKDTQEKEIMKLAESVEVHKELMVDRIMVRINDELYFEVQDRPPIFKENEDVYDDNGASIYKYNLNTKEIDFVGRGMSPRVYNDELIYIDNNQQANIVNMKGDIITDSVIDYYAHGDIIVAVRYVEEVCLMVLIKDGKEKVLFDRDFYERFWSITTNGKYITWQQSTSDLCFYDIEKDTLVEIKNATGATTIVSEKYLYWNQTIDDPNDKDNYQVTIRYIVFD